MSVPITPIDLGDVVRLKKPHPCGTNEWEIVRLGADIGLRCHGCDRKVMLVRSEFDRRFRGYISRVGGPTASPAEKPADAGGRDITAGAPESTRER